MINGSRDALCHFLLYSFFIARNTLEAIPTPSEYEDSISHKILKKLSDIYYGRHQHLWSMEIENWNKEQSKSNNTNTIYKDEKEQQFRC